MPRTFPEQPQRLIDKRVADGKAGESTTFRKFGMQPARITSR